MGADDGDSLARRLVRDRRFAHAVAVAAFLGSYAVLVRNVAVGRFYAFGDLTPYYGTRAFGKFLHTWHPQQLGYAYIYNVLPAYVGAVTAVGGPLAQNLLYLALIPLGYLTFAVFVGRFVESLPARHLSAFVYAINPITIAEFANGGLGAFVGYVGLPLVVHYLYAVVERDSWVAAVKAGAVFGATTVVPWLGFWMVAPFGLVLASRVRAAPRTLAKLVGAGLLGVVLSLPNVHHVLQRAGSIDTSRGLIFDGIAYNYAAADPLAVLRLAGNRGMRAMTVLGYNSEPTMLVGLVVPLVGLFAWHRDELRPYFLVAGGIVAFMVATAAGLTYPLFERLLPLLSLRNPVKIQYPLLFCESLLFGAGLQTMLDRAATRQRERPLLGSSGGPVVDGVDRKRVLVVLVVLLALVSYAAPAAGDLGLEATHGDDYAVPAEYDAVASSLDGRVMWLPYGYTTQLRLRDAYPNHVGIKSGGRMHGIQNTGYVTRLFEDFAAGEPVHDRLASLGVRYVVVGGDPPARYSDGPPRTVDRWGAPWLWGEPARFEARLNASGAYSQVRAVGEYTVYRVDGAEDRARLTRRYGLHAVTYPEETDVEAVGENLFRNPSFESGFESWWTPPADAPTETDVVDGEGDPAALLRTEDPGEAPLPIAQRVATRSGYPYRLSVDAEGEGTVLLNWYDGAKSRSNVTAVREFDVADLPAVTKARGDTLSVRVRPDGSRLRVREARLVRTTYPAATEHVPAAEGVPGVTVDARDTSPDDATTVAVNLSPDAAERADADVRVVDAETVLEGELVFGSQYRQGVAVRVSNETLAAVVPPAAEPVTATSPEGTVLDYWRVGSFDDQPVTVLGTSYDEQWTGGPDARHFRAMGWANGFTDTDPADVRWTGPSRQRTAVLAVWGLAWAAVLLVLGASAVVSVLRSRQGRGSRDGAYQASDGRDRL